MAAATTLMALSTAALAATAFGLIAAEMTGPGARLTPTLLMAAFDGGADAQVRAAALRAVLLLLAVPLGFGVLLGSADMRPGIAHLLVTIGGIATVALIVATPGATPVDLLPTVPSLDLSFDPDTGMPLSSGFTPPVDDRAARMAAIDELIRRTLAGTYLVLLSPPLSGLGAAIYRAMDRVIFPADPARYGR